MKSDNPVKLGIHDTLAAERFSRSGTTWTKEGAEAVLVVHLQKSNFGDQYYVAIGVYVKDLGKPGIAARTLNEEQCHVRSRADSLNGTREEWRPVLNLDDAGLAPEERRARAAELVRRVVVPWLALCATRSGLREAQREGRLKGALVDRRVRDAIA